MSDSRAPRDDRDRKKGEERSKEDDRGRKEERGGGRCSHQPSHPPPSPRHRAHSRSRSLTRRDRADDNSRQVRAVVDTRHVRADDNAHRERAPRDRRTARSQEFKRQHQGGGHHSHHNVEWHDEYQHDDRGQYQDYGCRDHQQHDHRPWSSPSYQSASSLPPVFARLGPCPPTDPLPTNIASIQATLSHCMAYAKSARESTRKCAKQVITMLVATYSDGDPLRQDVQELVKQKADTFSSAATAQLTSARAQYRVAKGLAPSLPHDDPELSRLFEDALEILVLASECVSDLQANSAEFGSMPGDAVSADWLRVLIPNWYHGVLDHPTYLPQAALDLTGVLPPHLSPQPAPPPPCVGCSKVQRDLQLAIDHGKDLSAVNGVLEASNAQQAADNNELTAENQRLAAANEKLTSENGAQAAQIKALSAKVRQLQTTQKALEERLAATKPAPKAAQRPALPGPPPAIGSIPPPPKPGSGAAATNFFLNKK